MKRFLLTFLTLALLASTSQIYSQCTVRNLGVEINSVTFNTTGCTFSFNLSWDQEINPGNKYAYIHLWNASLYHQPSAAWPAADPIYSGPSKYPASAQLTNTLANFVIENNNTLTPTLGATYWPDPAVGKVVTSATISKSVFATYERVVINNISLTFPDCSGLIMLQGDIWASQAQNKSNVHCASQGLAFALNDPLVSGQKNCTNPRTYDVTISTVSASAITVDYSVYTDDGDGNFDPGAGNDLKVDEETNISIPANGNYTGTALEYAGSGQPGEMSSLWIEARRTGSLYSTVAYLPNTCNPLPVRLSSFVAQRTKQSVVLKWETATEINNRGFRVQRNSRGIWETIGFVPSAASDGNSTSLLAYSFQDQNEEKGVTQYRLLQVDIDGKATYSPIRSVRGLEQADRTIVYPNPSANGKVNVVFDDGGAKEVVVSDMSGRMVRRYGSAVNNLVVEGLQRGMYYFRITDLSSAASTVEKVIIK